ncbi:MAG: ABC transporter ATP-binding protein [Thermoplasmatales archaeon]|nr:ABC transporter ATP-binding protein [Thermoplasmatales archaeon]
MIVSEKNVEKMDEISSLKVDGLVTQFFTSGGIVKALDSVSFSIKKGEVMGLVGESGCGKSVTATSVMDLIPDPPGRIIKGKIIIDGFNIVGDLEKLAKIRIISEKKVIIKRNRRMIKRHNFILSKIRGRTISMIFQEPSLSLNPVMTVGKQIMEPILLHNRIEISNSIIRRESINKEQIKTFCTDCLKIEDQMERRKYVNKWTQMFGVAESQGSILELFNSQASLQQIEDDLEGFLFSEREGTDLDIVEKVRDYYETGEKLFKLHTELLSAEEGKDSEMVEKILDSIKILKRDSNKRLFGFKVKYKLLRRRIDMPYEKEARRRALELLKLVNIAGAERVIDSYPHELSGGMQQRVMIAMALSSNPKILIADEPTTALDVTTQAQILELIKDLKAVTGTSILFITHDLGVVAEMCDKIGIMYAGNLVEEAPVNDIFYNPKHPYTIGLLRSIPRSDIKHSDILESIPGSVPNLIMPPSGCRFHPRCAFKMDICEAKKPKLRRISDNNNQKVACFLFSNEVE